MIARHRSAVTAAALAIAAGAALATFAAGVAVAAVAIVVLRPRWRLVLGAAIGCLVLAPVAAWAVGEPAANSLSVLVLCLTAVVVGQLLAAARAGAR